MLRIWKLLLDVQLLYVEEGGATAGGVDVRGGSPGTRETDLLNPQNLVDKIHGGVMLSGWFCFWIGCCFRSYEVFGGK